MQIATTAPRALRVLWQEGVFTAVLDVRDIESQLSKRGYNFGDKNLMMALKGAKYLTRRGARGSYTYIQKHPFAEETSDAHTR